MRIAVYCASSDESDPKYRTDAASLGKAIGEGGHQLIYGGGNIGSMGALADEAIRCGAQVVSVIPHFFHEQGLTHQQSDEIHVTRDMQERRKMMWERCDGVIALPGGLGTLEEISEMLVLNQLDLVKRPVVLANLEGYWDHLWGQFEVMEAQQMLPSGFQRYIERADDGPAALDLLLRSLEGSPDELG